MDQSIAAAAAAEVSERTCAKWVARYRARASSGCWIAPRRRVVANRTDERTIQAIAALRRLRFTGPEIAEVLEMPLSTVSGDPDADRDGQTRPARPGAGAAL